MARFSRRSLRRPFENNVLPPITLVEQHRNRHNCSLRAESVLKKSVFIRPRPIITLLAHIMDCTYCLPFTIPLQIGHLQIGQYTMPPPRTSRNRNMKKKLERSQILHQPLSATSSLPSASASHSLLHHYDPSKQETDRFTMADRSAYRLLKREKNREAKSCGVFKDHA